MHKLQVLADHPCHRGLSLCSRSTRDGFLAELYVRENPNLLELALSETEVAQLLSDIWNSATGQGTAGAVAMHSSTAASTARRKPKAGRAAKD